MNITQYFLSSIGSTGSHFFLTNLNSRSKDTNDSFKGRPIQKTPSEKPCWTKRFIREKELPALPKLPEKKYSENEFFVYFIERHKKGMIPLRILRRVYRYCTGKGLLVKYLGKRKLVVKKIGNMYFVLGIKWSPKTCLLPSELFINPEIQKK